MKRKKVHKRAKQAHIPVAAKDEMQESSIFYSEPDIRRIENLNAEVNALLVTTDSLRILKDEIVNIQDRMSVTSSDIQDYLDRCVSLKENECKTLTAHLKALQEWINAQKKAHEDQIARLLLEIDEVEERLGLEKTILTGKISSMEDIRVQRDEMQWKFSEMQRMLDETTSANRTEYCLMDLELTIIQHRLLEEMKERVRNLADAFKLATEQRREKVQMETVDKNGRLSRQLSLMGTGVLTVLDKNKSLQAVNSHLQKDVSTLKEVNEQMRSKFALHLKHLEQTIRNCQAQQNDLHVLRGKGSVQIPRDAGPPDLEPENIEKELSSKVEPTRIQLDQLKMQYEQTERRIKAELIRLEDANAARQLLNEMVSEVARSLRDAHELFQPEVVLASSEKQHRKNRLLAALFVLLSTSDLLGSRTTLRQLGISSINRSSSPPYRLPFMNRFCSPTVGTEHSCAASIAGALKIHHLVTTDLLEYGPKEHNTSSCAQLTSELLRGPHQHLRYQDKPSSFVRSVTVKAVPRAETASQYQSMPALQTSTSDQYASVRLPKLRNKPRMRLQHSSRMFRIFNPPDQECLPSLYPLTVL